MPELMTFGGALDILLCGECSAIKRMNWNDRIVYKDNVFVSDVLGDITLSGMLIRMDTDGVGHTWMPTMDDMCCRYDWMCIE